MDKCDFCGNYHRGGVITPFSYIAGICPYDPDGKASLNIEARICELTEKRRNRMITQHEKEDIRLSELVENKIEQVFLDIAEGVGDGSIDVSMFTEDEIAGIPYTIFSASTYMIEAWRSYMRGKR